MSSPSLRKYLQIQARLVSEDREIGATLRRVAVELHTPVARSLEAEVWPVDVQVGLLDTFELFVQPQFIERPGALRSLGFDEMRIGADPLLDLRLLDVSVGSEQEFLIDAPEQLFLNPATGGLANADGELLQVESDSGDSLLILFPQVINSGIGEQSQ